MGILVVIALIQTKELFSIGELFLNVFLDFLGANHYLHSACIRHVKTFIIY